MQTAGNNGVYNEHIRLGTNLDTKGHTQTIVRMLTGSVRKFPDTAIIIAICMDVK